MSRVYERQQKVCPCGERFLGGPTARWCIDCQEERARQCTQRRKINICTIKQLQRKKDEKQIGKSKRNEVRSFDSK